MAMSIGWLKRRSTKLRNWPPLSPTLCFGNKLICPQFSLSSEQTNFFFFWPYCVAYRISVLQPGIELGSWQWKPGILTTATRELPEQNSYKIYWHKCNILGALERRKISPLDLSAEAAVYRGLPWWFSGKESACSAGSILGQEDPPEKEW